MTLHQALPVRQAAREDKEPTLSVSAHPGEMFLVN